MSFFEEEKSVNTEQHSLWAEKYRPDVVDNYICSEQLRGILKDFISRKDIPHLLFHGNAGTMTESGFWSFIRSGLRQKSRWWKPITECKMKARRAYKGPSKRQKFEYQCNSWYQVCSSSSTGSSKRTTYWCWIG